MRKTWAKIVEVYLRTLNFPKIIKTKARGKYDDNDVDFSVYSNNFLFIGCNRIVKKGKTSN